MSNEAKMTLEERIVQTLKDDHLMKLVGDEDAITHLVHRAINEALYEPRYVPNPNGYGQQQKKDSVSVAAARDVAEAAAKALAADLTAELLEDPDFRERVKRGIINAIPNTLLNTFECQIKDAARMMAFEEIYKLRDELKP